MICFSMPLTPTENGGHILNKKGCKKMCVPSNTWRDIGSGEALKTFEYFKQHMDIRDIGQGEHLLVPNK